MELCACERPISARFNQASALFDTVHFTNANGLTYGEGCHVLRLLATCLVSARCVLVQILNFLRYLSGSVTIVKESRERLLARYAPVFVNARDFRLLIRCLHLLCNSDLIGSANVARRAMYGTVVPRILTILMDVVLIYFKNVRRNRTRNIIIQLIPTMFTIVRSECTVISAAIDRVNPVLYVSFMNDLHVITPPRASGSRVMNNFHVYRIREGFNLRRDVKRLPIRLVMGICTINATALVRASMLLRR